MKPKWWVLSTAVVLGFVFLFVPIVTTLSQAQMVPMAGQPLEQLSGEEFDKAFLSEMVMHHGMAVMMARPVVANAEHQELKDLAQRMIDDQTREIVQMRAWAKDWYGVEIADPVATMDQMMGASQDMPGMNHPGMGSGMGSGMGMPMQHGPQANQTGNMSMMQDMSMMSSLSKLPPQRLEVVFMSQMIPHHQSAIDMAGLVPDRAARQELKDLATSIINSQASEVDMMNGWLGTWYGL